MHKMYEMIMKQPEALRYTVASCAGPASSGTAAAAAMSLKGRRVYITGCGSSFHAALYGEHVLRAGGFDAFTIHALDMLHHPPGLRNALAVVVSHSWKTRTTLNALRLLRRKDVPCIGITANKAAKGLRSLLRSSEDFDGSDCVTMGYTTELLALALTAAAGRGRGRRELEQVPESVDVALKTEEQVRELADLYSGRQRFFILGAGPDTATAYEAALKMKEGNFTDAEGMQLEQLLHGSISGVDADDIVVVVAPRASGAHRRTLDALRAIRRIGADTITVTDSDEIATMCTHAIRIPGCSEYTSPIISIVPLQLFAYHLAAKNGINPDLTREDDLRYREAYSELDLHLD